MRLWILSDLHLETIPFPSQFKPQAGDFDVLVLAGDVWEGDTIRGMRVARRLAGDRPVVFVMGNHDHWCGEIEENLFVARAAARAEGVVLLDRESATIEGVRFLGCTLWSDYALGGHVDERASTGEQVDVAHSGGNHLLTVKDAKRLHRVDRRWLEGELGSACQAPTVVVTHHAPCAECVPPKALGGWWAGNSASDLSALTDAGNVSLWVHGHVHRRNDIVRPGGTRVVCNPAGPKFSTPGFDEGWVVELS